MPSIQPWVTCELTLLSFSAVWRCPVYNAVPDPHLEIRVVPRGRVHRTFYGGWRSGTLGWRTLVRRGKKTSVARRCLQKDFWQHRGWWGLGRNASQNSAASLQCTEAGSIKARGRGGRKTRFVPEPRLRRFDPPSFQDAAHYIFPVKYPRVLRAWSSSEFWKSFLLNTVL